MPNKKEKDLTKFFIDKKYNPGKVTKSSTICPNCKNKDMITGYKINKVTKYSNRPRFRYCSNCYYGWMI
jgi:hypothetical protein